MNHFARLKSVVIYIFFSLFMTVNLEAGEAGSSRYSERFEKVPPEGEEPVKEGEEDGRGNGSKGGKTGKKKKKDIAVSGWYKGTDSLALTIEAESGQLVSFVNNGFLGPGSPHILDSEYLGLAPSGRGGLLGHTRGIFAEEAGIAFLDENGLSLWSSDLQIRQLVGISRGPFLSVGDNPSGIVGFDPYSSFGRLSEEFKQIPSSAPPLTLDEVDLSGITYRVNGPFDISDRVSITTEEVHEILDEAMLGLINSKSLDVRDLMLELGRQKDFKTVIEVDDYDFANLEMLVQLVDSAPPGAGGMFNSARVRPIENQWAREGSLIQLPIIILAERTGLTDFFRFGENRDLELELLHEFVHVGQNLKQSQGQAFVDGAWHLSVSFHDYVVAIAVLDAKESEYEPTSYENRHNQLDPARKEIFPIRTHYRYWELPHWARTYPFKRFDRPFLLDGMF